MHAGPREDEQAAVVVDSGPLPYIGTGEADMRTTGAAREVQQVGQGRLLDGLFLNGRRRSARAAHVSGERCVDRRSAMEMVLPQIFLCSLLLSLSELRTMPQQVSFCGLKTWLKQCKVSEFSGSRYSLRPSMVYASCDNSTVNCQMSLVCKLDAEVWPLALFAFTRMVQRWNSINPDIIICTNLGVFTSLFQQWRLQTFQAAECLLFPVVTRASTHRRLPMPTTHQ